MTVSHPPVLEFPDMLHGLTGAVLRKVRVKGSDWAREYLKTGDFTQPRRMRQVLPGQLLEVRSGILFDSEPHARWRMHLFSDVFLSLEEGIPKEQHRKMQDAFESFCLSTPWGALYHAVSPPPLRSAQRMAQRLAALLRFWDVLQGARYAYWHDRQYTLDELVEDIYGRTLEAWCPGSQTSVREHLELAVERMARATREDCLKAVLRVIPRMVEANVHLKHRERLLDPIFLRERLAELSPDDFEDLSSAYCFTVSGALYTWDRQLGAS